MTAGCALSACGGGDGGTMPATASTKTSTPAQPMSCASVLALGTPLTPKCHVTIYYSGDSTNWGVDVDDTGNQVQYPGIGQGVGGRTNPTPMQQLQTWADKTYGPGVVGFLADGSIPGTTCENDVNGTAPSLAPLATRLASLPIHADIVMTNTEINDQYLIGSTVAQYTSCLQQWIGAVAQYGAVPVYQEPNPISRSDANYAVTNSMVLAADQTFTNAGGHALGNLASWENYTAPPNASPWNIIWMSSDDVHPDDAGYVVKASNYFNGVPTLLASTDSLKNVINGVLSGISQ
jgi:lysophospholipase L1-like esterase